VALDPLDGIPVDLRLWVYQGRVANGKLHAIEPEGSDAG
jgi:hypothetical protein